MMRAYLAPSIAFALFLAAGPGATQTAAERTSTRAHDTRAIEFPVTAKGNQVLAVDTHTHTVFSDGYVWPQVRVWEAEQDHLAAYAVTDHLEYQPHKDDIAVADHNRSYEIAAAEAARIGARTHVIRGVEVTRDRPWGHFNAIFLKDANALPLDTTLKADPRPALKAARVQGAYVIWNHPWALPGLDDASTDPMPAEQQALLLEGLIDAVEIANGSQYSALAFDIALKHGLAVVGASDVHTPVDVDLQIPEGQHRTVTLVLAADDTVEAIRQAFIHRRTAALYRQSLYGREPELSEIVGAALHMSSKKRVENFMTKDLVEVELRNDSFLPFELRVASASPLTTPRVFSLPAHGKMVVQFANAPDVAEFAVELQVLNAYVDPDRNLTLTLR